MNVSKAIEIAFAEVIRDHAEIGEDVVIRPWQTLAADGSWAENPDRAFPVIDIRCGPPMTDGNQTTLSVECSILMGTKTDDDKDHAFVSQMYEAVQELCDTLFAQFRNGAGTYSEDPLKQFLDSITANSGATLFGFGGFTFAEGLAPVDENGINMVGIAMVTHYSRADF